MIKIIRDIYSIYGFIIIKITKRSLVLDYGLSNAIVEPPNHVFTWKWIKTQKTNLFVNNK
jgi:hypothetical protein